MDDKKLLAGNDLRQQDHHRLAVRAARVDDGDQRAAFDQVPVLGRDGNVGWAAPWGASRASRPRWSVRNMLSVI